MFKTLSVLGLLIVTACATSGERPHDRVGDSYEIALKRTTETSSDGSSSSSNSRYTLIEKVVALRSDGVELEFDLPGDTSLEDRTKEWQFPVRVLKQVGRPHELLNRRQLQDRVQSWLTKWDIPKKSCGQWVFTWTAIKIECDPDSVLGALKPFDLRYGDLREGALYSEPFALEAARLRTEINSSGRPVYVATLNIDPDEVRRMRAEESVVVAAIFGEEPVTFESALRQLDTGRISGSITTRLEVDEVGRVTRRTRTTEILTIREDGDTERENITETVQRKRINDVD